MLVRAPRLFTFLSLITALLFLPNCVDQKTTVLKIDSYVSATLLGPVSSDSSPNPEETLAASGLIQLLQNGSFSHVQEFSNEISETNAGKYKLKASGEIDVSFPNSENFLLGARSESEDFLFLGGSGFGVNQGLGLTFATLSLPAAKGFVPTVCPLSLGNYNLFGCRFLHPQFPQQAFEDSVRTLSGSLNLNPNCSSSTFTFQGMDSAGVEIVSGGELSLEGSSLPAQLTFNVEGIFSETWQGSGIGLGPKIILLSDNSLENGDAGIYIALQRLSVDVQTVPSGTYRVGRLIFRSDASQSFTTSFEPNYRTFYADGSFVDSPCAGVGCLQPPTAEGIYSPGDESLTFTMTDASLNRTVQTAFSNDHQMFIGVETPSAPSDPIEETAFLIGIRITP